MKKIFMFALLLLCACTTPLQYDRSKFLIASDVGFLSINTNNTIRERDGQLLAQISGISTKDQSIYYKVVWFDVNGMKISTSLTQWKKVNLRENAEFFWTVVAPSKRAMTYKVYITDNIGNGLIK